MAALIALVIIGLVFFFGIAMDHKHWTGRDVLMSFPCLIGVVLLWPLGLMRLAWHDCKRLAERNMKQVKP